MPRSRRRCGSHSGLARCPGSEVRCQSRGRFGEAGKARRRGIVGAIPRRSNAASVVETPPNLVTDFGFGTLVAAHLAQLVALVAPQRDHLPAPALERALLPHTEPAPEIVGIEPEDVADVLEGEEPRLVGILDPLLGLVEELLAAGVLRPGLLAVHVDRVLEHGDHETALAVMLAAPADPIEELRRQQGVGLEEPGQPLVDGVFTVFHLTLPLPFNIVPSGTQNSRLFLRLCLRRPRGGRIQPGHHTGRYPRSPHVGDRRLFEEIHDTALPLAPYPLHTAGAKQRAVRRLARTHVERDGPLHRLDHVAEGHLLGRTGEDVAAVRPAAGAHQALVDQLLDELLEELPGHALALPDLADRAGAGAGPLLRPVGHRPGRVVALPAH